MKKLSKYLPVMISMCLSTIFLAGALLLGGGNGIALLFLVFIPGLVGLYFCTKLENSYMKWLLFGVNYVFATLINFLWNVLSHWLNL
ncbi:hypothetical protein A5844_001505 [Enterococcus sp. 10A9_DIV0425]|uniref:Uncharacterized protein n=1 Tax=Candidatus Enterococcus wittei TaxID=1987383 RepID=A0A242K139_9ENTE|nr:hypothetical protein [Enterococcus sp. 10A9_DIV0425]OTP11370.1 hypothetical protein A5844_001505 [Enterococcus sp. 10A9_DIV0425]THE09476.1 hypothetical protein E1H99_10955 [Enterococcus hirae]